MNHKLRSSPYSLRPMEILHCKGFTGCTVHPVKPLQCKTSMGRKEYGEDLSLWFMLNHQVNPNDPESIRQYAIYLKTQRTLPGGSLKELVPDKEKLKNMLNFNKLK